MKIINVSKIEAHMFWWYYRSPQRTNDPNKPWPIILWLQGGPSALGVGIGNFEEVGPLDTFFKDNTVGTRYSFVEDKSLFVKTDEEAAADLTTLLVSVFNRDKVLQKCPLYMVAESNGGKYAVTLGLSALRLLKPEN